MTEPSKEKGGLLGLLGQPAWRRRLGFLVIIVGLLVIGPMLFKRDMELTIALPPGATRLRVEVVRDGAIYRGLEVRVRPGESVHREQLSLPAGSYQIEATVSLAEGWETREKSVELPTDEPVEIRF